MKIVRFVITGIDPFTGKVKDGGSVVTDGFIRMSMGEGCGAIGCRCSDGYWISIGEPVKTIDDEEEFGSIVEGIKVEFDNKEEMNKFLNFHEILGVGKEDSII